MKTVSLKLMGGTGTKTLAALAEKKDAYALFLIVYGYNTIPNRMRKL